MKSISLFSSAIIIISIFSFCNNPEPNYTIKKQPQITTDTINYCAILDTIYNERYYGTTNQFQNKYIPLIVEKTNIECNASRSIGGYWYEKDSVFVIDYNAWKKALACN